MNFEFKNVVNELTEDMVSAISFVTGERSVVAFADPEPISAKSKLIARYTIMGEFSTDSIDGEIKANFTVLNDIATFKELQFKFGDRDIVTVDYHEHIAFINALQNAYTLYKIWLRKPTHRADIKELIEGAIEDIKNNNLQDAIAKLDTSLETI